MDGAAGPPTVLTNGDEDEKRGKAEAQRVAGVIAEAHDAAAQRGGHHHAHKPA